MTKKQAEINSPLRWTNAPIAFIIKTGICRVICGVELILDFIRCLFPDPFADVINEFVFQDCDEPCPGRRTTLEIFAGF
jgi:hypothetical protein